MNTISKEQLDEVINGDAFDEASLAAAFNEISDLIKSSLCISTGDKKSDAALYVHDGQRLCCAGAAGLEPEIIRLINLLNARIGERIDKIKGDNKEDRQARDALRSKADLLAHYTSTTRRRSLETTIRTMKMILEKNAGLDADHNKINHKNLVYDLVAHTTEEHAPGQRFTCMTNISYDDRATAPLFLKHLEYVLPDSATREYLLEAVASALFRGRNEEVIFLLWGITAGNGKTELFRMIITALGDYGTWLDSKGFTSKRAGNATQPEIRMAIGKALAVVDEPDKGDMDSGLTKTAANFAEIVMRDLYKSSKAERWTATIFLLCNLLPNLDTKDAGNVRRLVVIPFKQQITAEMKAADERPPEYRNMRYGEYVGTKEAAGIYNILMDALKRFEARGYKLPPTSAEMKEATSEYVYRGNSVARFVSEKCDKVDGEAINAAEFHSKFLSYCTQELQHSHDKLMLPGSIKEAMASLGFEYKQKKKDGENIGWSYHGLTWKPPDPTPEIRGIIVKHLMAFSKCTTDNFIKVNPRQEPDLIKKVLRNMAAREEIKDLGNDSWGYKAPA